MTGTLTARLALAAGSSGGDGGGIPPSLDDKAETLLWVCGAGKATASIASVAGYTRDPDLARPEVKELAYLKLMKGYADSLSWPVGEINTMMHLIAERDPAFTHAFETFASGKSFAEWREGITVTDGAARHLRHQPG